MFRFTTSALILAAILSAAGCGDAVPDTSFVSEAVAAPSQAPDYGWRTPMAPEADSGTVTQYD